VRSLLFCLLVLIETVAMGERWLKVIGRAAGKAENEQEDADDCEREGIWTNEIER
jgi:hypothetical protein